MQLTRAYLHYRRYRRVRSIGLTVDDTFAKACMSVPCRYPLWWALNIQSSSLVTAGSLATSEGGIEVVAALSEPAASSSVLVLTITESSVSLM